jgi:hypothetical protein
VAVAASLFAFPAISVSSESAFDGHWAVEIVPESGDCRARTVALKVDEGEISYAGFGARADGNISPEGALSVTISRLDKVVNASGSVAGTTGVGNWASPDCEGTWVARRS